MIEKTLPVQPQSRPKLPSWLKKSLPTSETYQKTRSLLKELKLQTVCEEARCPNQGECWSKHLATVLIMGPNCTRTCSFCSVPKGEPQPLDPEEPVRLAEAIERLGLRYLVLTSVTRDDLLDGGASHFVRCIDELRSRIADIKVEILTPDFQFSLERSLECFTGHLPDVWAHNIETVDRLARKARIRGSQEATLACLQAIKNYFPDLDTKSGLMLGMGETDEEIEETLQKLRAVGVTRMTMGQYLRPTPHHMPVKEFVTPEKFLFWQNHLKAMGFTVIECHPFARSSYQS